MKLSEMKQVLSAGNIQLAKSLGQNFLHDANQLRRIVAAADLSESDRVLEVGPGLGPLTELLLAKARQVLAIEKDRRLVEFLRERLGSAENLVLVHDDALDYVEQKRLDLTEWKLVANLPYSVASRLLVELAQMERGPCLMVATLQMEVAQRLLAQAGDEDYGLLTLLVQLRYQPDAWFKIPPSCFFPEPGVDSACLKLFRRAEPLLSLAHGTIFTAIVKRSFSQRRKMMLKLLKNDWPAKALEAAFEQVGLSAQIRAEAVGLDQFVKITQILAEGRMGVQNMNEEIFDIVNEFDEVIGQQARSEVHRLGRKHRAVHVLVFNERGEIFLQKRSRTKDTFPGAWDSSASGHLNTGETYDACAVRELGEELGVELAAPPEKLFKMAACQETGQEHVWVYRQQAEGPFHLHPEEIETGGWFAPAAVTRWMEEQPQAFASALLRIWRRLCEEKGKAR